MIQNELGDQLRRARESKSLSLEEVEKAIGIRKRFLQAMEEGRFDVLPGAVQARGFLRNYAKCVGLNGDEMLALYERQTRSAQTTAALQSASPARPVTLRPTPPQPLKLPPAPPTVTISPTQPVSPPSTVSTPSTQPVNPPPLSATQPAPVPQATAPAASPASLARPVPVANGVQSGWVSRLPAWLTLEVVLIAMAVILVACVAVLVVSLLTGSASGQRPAPTPRPTATRAARVAPLPTFPPAEPTLTPPPNITSSVRTTGTTGYVQVALTATEHVWVRVTTDGQTAFEGMFSPGQVLNWEAKELLIVESGNGAGLTASFNSKPVGVLGPRGQLVARAWMPTGETMVPPKPTPSLPTPSPTP